MTVNMDDGEMEQRQDDLVDWIHQNRPADLPVANVARLERRVLNHFQRQKRLARQPQRQPVLQWAFALAFVFLFAVVSTGVVSASESSLPGEPLYTVKRLAENVQLALTPASERTSLHLEFAEERLEEIEDLGQQGIVRADVLDELSRETELAVTGAENLAGDKQVEVLETLERLTERQQVVLDRVEDNAPQPAQAALDHAQDVSGQGHERAQQALEQLQEPTSSAIMATQTVTATVTEPDKVTKTPRPSHTPQPTHPNNANQTHTPPGRAATSTLEPDTPTVQVNPPTSQPPTATAQAPTATAESSNNGNGNGNGNNGDNGNGNGNGNGNNGNNNNGNGGGNNGNGNGNGGGNGNGNDEDKDKDKDD